MSTESKANLVVFNTEKLAVRIRAALLRKGLNLKKLSELTGLSRVTVTHLAQGRTRRPRNSTLRRIADVLEFSLESLCALSSIQGGTLRNITNGNPEQSRVFDKATNRAISEVHREFPGLFTDWKAEEWDELYSTFGTGGSLSSEGVVETARQMNRKRETRHKMNVVLETHLGDVATNLIETLYGMVRFESNQADTAELAELMAQCRSEDDGEKSQPAEAVRELKTL